jgi:hypothetical protein
MHVRNIAEFKDVSRVCNRSTSLFDLRQEGTAERQETRRGFDQTVGDRVLLLIPLDVFH